MPAPPAALYPPRVNAFTRAFYDALAGGELTTTGCRDCGKTTPDRCRFQLSADQEKRCRRRIRAGQAI